MSKSQLSRHFYYVGSYCELDDLLLVSENEVDFYMLDGDFVNSKLLPRTRHHYHLSELKQIRPATPKSFEQFRVMAPSDFIPVPSWNSVIRLLGHEMNSGGDLSVTSLSTLFQGIEWSERLGITPIRLLSMDEQAIRDAVWASYRDDLAREQSRLGKSIVPIAEKTDETIKNLEKIEARHPDLFQIYPKASTELVETLEMRERFLKKAQQAVSAYLELDPRYIERIVDRRYREKQENARLRSDL